MYCNYPSDILDYFKTKEEIKESGLWDALRINHIDRNDAVNTTAKILTENGLSFIAARNLHKNE